jgi:hypothetical protein
MTVPNEPPDETTPDDDPLADEPFRIPDSSAEGDDKGVKGFMPEFVRKVAVAGLGALFMTEEGIRNLAGQLKLPKELLGFIVNQAEKTKEEVGRVVSDEIRRFLQSEKLREEFVKLIAGTTLEIKAEIRLLPKAESSGAAAEGIAPEVVVSEVGARRGRRKKE